MKINKSKTKKAIVSIATLASLGYFSSGFYYLKPNQNAWINRTIPITEDISDIKQEAVTSTGLHFRWRGIQELKKYETNKDISLEETIEDFKKIYDYNETLKKEIQTNPITTNEQLEAEIKKIAEHYKKLGISDKVIMPRGIKFKKFGSDIADTLGGYITVDNFIDVNDRYQNDPEWIKHHPLLHTLIHEFMHIQGLDDESYTECLAYELEASLAKKEKIYESSLLTRLSGVLIYNMYFLALRDKSLPHNYQDKLIEEMALPGMSTSYYYDKDGKQVKIEDDLFEKSADKINEIIFSLRTKGKKELIDKIVKEKLPKERYGDLKRRMEERLETNEFDITVYEYSGTTYQMIKDAMANGNILKEVPFDLEEKNVSINNLAQELEKILKK